MPLNNAAHKAARDNVIKTLGLSDLPDGMIQAAEQSYAAGRKAIPYLVINLPSKWRKRVGNLQSSELVHMVYEVLKEDRRLVNPRVDHEFSGFMGARQSVILYADEIDH